MCDEASMVNKVALQGSRGGQGASVAGGSGNDEILMSMVENLSNSVESRHARVMESVQEIDQRLRNVDKKLARAVLPGGGASSGPSAVVRPEPAVEAPLPADAMDAIKQDLHFAIASAVRNVLDKHPGGVVLLNIPDHNKPAGKSIPLWPCPVAVASLQGRVMKINAGQLLQTVSRSRATRSSPVSWIYFWTEMFGAVLPLPLVKNCRMPAFLSSCRSQEVTLNVNGPGIERSKG
jgi:hypothetical protein